jgi:hypothetical protein
MHKSVFIFSLLFNILAFGQNSFTTVIKDSLANELLSGATAKIKGTNNGEIADREGKVMVSGCFYH